ncbi:alpha amylase [Colletotrichum tofieldiae]|uniref:Alpha amylase n=1 Tax=Colletotrichum tofieldiae TaxID=708197 RepID=A0A166QFK2_9PEZI|nr:alpha amylase [Colletotrichum tofieldiae]
MRTLTFAWAAVLALSALISPIVKNIDNNTASLNNYAINNKYSTKEDFKALIIEIHKHDIYVIVNVVINNIVQKLNELLPKLNYSKFNLFNKVKFFYPYCNVTKKLVLNYSINGLCINAAKHVNDKFLPSFVNASGVFTFGKVLTGATADFCCY